MSVDPERERKLLRALIDLGGVEEPERFVTEALALLTHAAEARLGYLAFGCRSDAPPRWWAAVGPDGAEATRDRLSGALVDTVLRERRLLTTDAARDPRFRQRESVRRNRIEGVIGVALGEPPDGVLLVQGRLPPGPELVELLERAARLLAPLAERLLWRARWSGPDPTLGPRAVLDAERVVGRSAALAVLLDEVRVVAPSRVPILVTGEVGTGKSELVRVLHTHGPDPDGPLVTVDCTLLHPERAAADLFGARKGSWTGLGEDRVGLVEAAEGGTLFLDEIGDLAPAVQAQLLLLLQDGVYRRLGETRERRARVRCVAATHRDLPARVAAGAFRADLYSRLAGWVLRLPPLRERLEDVALIASTVLPAEAERLGVGVRPLSPAAHAWLERQEWPDNVRGLITAVRAGLLWAAAAGAAAIGPEHLSRGEARPVTPGDDDLRSAVASFRLAHVRRVLDAEGGNVTRAARRLGLSRTHLHEILRPLSDPPDTGDPEPSGGPDVRGGTVLR